MDEKTGKNEAVGQPIPVTMSWIGEHRLCLSKEEAAKRRPPKDPSIPVSMDWLKAKTVDGRADKDYPAPLTQTVQTPGRGNSDSHCAE